MNSQNYTDLEQKYRRFDKGSKVFLYGLLAVAVVFCGMVLLADDGVFQLLAGFGLVVCAVVMIIATQKILKKRECFMQQLHQERNGVSRSGLFAEIYEAYNHDGFEFGLVYDRLLHMQYHNGSIDMGIVKNGHEFLIDIDETEVSILADEETQNPKAARFPLESIESLQALYETLNDFINGHS